MSALGTSYPALVCGRTGCIIRSVNRRAAGQQSVGQGRAAVARQWTQLGVCTDQVARHRATAVILDQVIAAGNNISRSARRKTLAGVPLVACDDRVGQGEGRHKAAAELPNEEGGGSPVRADVVGKGGVGDRDVPIGLEDGATMPAG